MTTDEEKYQRLIPYNKIMISLVDISCVIISGYVFLKMREIIIPLVLALIIYFMLNPVLSFSDKKIIPEIITILVIILPTFVYLFGIGHMISKNIDSFSENIHHYEKRFKPIVDQISDSGCRMWDTRYEIWEKIWNL
jgi:predicted PurR-regulated permease PerM